MKLIVFTVLMFVFIAWVGVKNGIAETPSEKDLVSFNTLTTLKASLLPFQSEINQAAQANAAADADKEKKLQRIEIKPELIAAYDSAAKAFNSANDSWKVLEFAKKLGKGDGKARSQFQKDLNKAIAESAKLHLGRGIVP